MENLMYVVPAAGAVALVCALLLTRWITGHDAGDARMKEIAGFIREGAMAFLRREYTTVAVFVAVVFVLICVLPGLGVRMALCFLLGAALSVLAGFMGMNVATHANVRTAAAARTGSMKKALVVAFRGGAVLLVTRLSSTIIKLRSLL